MQFILIIFLLALGASSTHASEPLGGTEITVFGAYTAFLISPTKRYQHGALGDNIEAAGFAVLENGKTRTFMLPETQVFEDLRVRLHDLDGDGLPEAIIIRSDIAKGGSIAVFSLNGENITLKAATDFIGQPNRWLNIVGFGDFAGDGTTMIAAVITPHLNGSLRIYDLVKGNLLERARINGFSNHINGTTNLDLAELRDVNEDGVIDIVLPRLDHSGKAAVSFNGGRPEVLSP